MVTDVGIWLELQASKAQSSAELGKSLIQAIIGMAAKASNQAFIVEQYRFACPNRKTLLEAVFNPFRLLLMQSL